ncbi:MAG: hypothetical protein MUP99_05030 [Pedobacter sp.]|nr:hypothetical protein [Pedobacter sp.]
MTIEELEGYFTGIELPDQIELETGVVIVDVPLFLQSHFDYIKDNPTLKSIDVFMLRLHKAMGIIEAKGEEEEGTKADVQEEPESATATVVTDSNDQA